MHYFDTSFVAPLIREESASSSIVQFVAQLPVGRSAISWWTEVEFASLLGRHVRMRVIQADDAHEAETFFEDIVRRTFVVWPLSSDDYDLARRYLRNHETRLRAGDALHLAIARNRRAEAVYTLDKAMIKAGKILGLPISSGIGTD